VYMHRMNAFTVEKIRANYLLEHIKNINSEIMVLESNASNLNTQEAKRLDTLRVDLRECETYDMELKNVADQQISFELDDGVTVNYKKFETVVAKIK
jgi:uroporphyrinogen-III synthase